MRRVRPKERKSEDDEGSVISRLVEPREEGDAANARQDVLFDDGETVGEGLTAGLCHVHFHHTHVVLRSQAQMLAAEQQLHFRQAVIFHTRAGLSFEQGGEAAAAGGGVGCGAAGVDGAAQRLVDRHWHRQQSRARVDDRATASCRRRPARPCHDSVADLEVLEGGDPGVDPARLQFDVLQALRLEALRQVQSSAEAVVDVSVPEADGEAPDPHMREEGGLAKVCQVILAHADDAVVRRAPEPLQRLLLHEPHARVRGLHECRAAVVLESHDVLFVVDSERSRAVSDEKGFVRNLEERVRLTRSVQRVALAALVLALCRAGH
mmetsp:Transcript_25655/g.65195  ORF Transcript_25655/g.65195 Transcript_25655/m.65195 type:complete len:322 (+) Transcript_25655:690-1655(+)